MFGFCNTKEVSSVCIIERHSKIFPDIHSMYIAREGREGKRNETWYNKRCGIFVELTQKVVFRLYYRNVYQSSACLLWTTVKASWGYTGHHYTTNTYNIL